MECDHDFLEKISALDVRIAAAHDLVTLATRDVMLPVNSEVMLFAITLGIVAMISIMMMLFKKHRRTKKFATFLEEVEDLDSPSRSDSIDESCQKCDTAMEHTRYFSELYAAADKCFIKKYAERCEKLINYFPHLINVKYDISGQTPFHRVCFHGHASLMQLMLANGANLHLCSDAGESPMCLAVYYYTFNTDSGHDDAVSCLDILQRAGCSIDGNSVWYDLLVKMAICAGNKTMMRWMLMNGQPKEPKKITKFSGLASRSSSNII